MKAMRLVLVLIVLFGILGASSAFVVRETDQVFITQFGEPVGDPIISPGLHFKLPFIQKLRYYDKRILEWDGSPNEVTTQDKKFIAIDMYARWRISDPLMFYNNVTDELGAQTRLDDILDGQARVVIAKNDLVEIVRSIQREVQQSLSAGPDGEVGVLPDFNIGRNQIVKEILESSKPPLAELGIELIDIRFKRINYSDEVQREIYNRMIAERQRIAEEFRSEGAGEAARIEGQRQRELKTIESEAYRKAQEIVGRADADAVRVYAEAFNQSPESQEFYEFLKTLETYESSISTNDQLILSTDTDFYKYLKSATPGEQ